MFSPLAKKRLSAFLRLRRAKWSLAGLVAIFLFCLFAEWTVPCKPGDVENPKNLEKHRTIDVLVVPDLRLGRCDLTADLQAVQCIACNTFISAGEHFDKIYPVLPEFSKTFADRLAGKARPEETFQLTSENGRKVTVTLPAVKERGRRKTVRILFRDDAEQKLPFRLTMGMNGPVEKKLWAKVPEQNRAEIISLAADAALGAPVAKRFSWGLVQCTRTEISWPFHPVPGHPMGLDGAGRDVYAQIVYGLRIALCFGLLLVVWAFIGGIVIGALQGYFGGWTDILGQRATEIWSAMPFLYVMIFIGSALGRSFALLLLCYGLFNWIGVAAYTRAEFLRLRTRPFVEAARCQGLPVRRILFAHILPNATAPLVTLFPFCLIGAIGSLAALDFLGFGLPPLTPSLGELLQQAQQFRWAWWLILFPSLALFVVMLLAVFVGEGLREAFDPKAR